jgi:lipopolysaccharide export system permease protein
MRNVLVFAASISVVVAVLSLVIVPDVLANRYELEQKAKVAADTSGLVAGNFKESKNGDWTFYAESLANDNQTMKNIFIEIHRQDRPMIFRAQQGQFEIDDNSGDKFLVLKNGYRYQGEAGQQDFIIAKFETHNLLVEKGGDKQVREKHKSLPTSILWDRASNKDLSELQWRIATAVMTIVLCLFAIKLSDTGPRKGRYAGFFPAILLYIVYSNLLAVNKTWIDKGVLTPWLGSVWVHVVMLLILWALLNQRKLLLMVSAYKQAKGKAI